MSPVKLDELDLSSEGEKAEEEDEEIEEEKEKAEDAELSEEEGGDNNDNEDDDDLDDAAEDGVPASALAALQRRLLRDGGGGRSGVPAGAKMDVSQLPAAAGGGGSAQDVLDLLEVGASSALRKELRQVSKKKQKLVQAPRPQLEAKSERVASYESARRDLQRWFGFVESNRLAGERQFPAEAPDTLRPQSAMEYQRRPLLEAKEAVERPERLGDSLEARLYAKLYAPAALGTVAAAGEGEGDAKVAALSSEAVQERLIARRRLQARQHFLEAKLKRQARIKSKSYRRHARRAKNKQEEAELAELKESDPAEFAARMEQLERARAEERMSQRHRAGGKFARRQRLRAKFDDTAREAVQEMIQAGKAITAKPDEGDTDGEEEEKEAAAMRREEGKRRAAAEVAEVGAALSKELSVDWDAAAEAADDAEFGEVEEETVPTSLRPAKRVARDEAPARPGKTLRLDLDLGHLPEVAETEGDLLDVAERRRLMRARNDELLLVAGGEAGDGEGGDFAAEKEAVAEAEQPKDVDLFLPGWNAWTGAGTREPSEAAKSRFRLKAPARRRRDARLRHVIVREKLQCGQAMRKHLVKEVPFPFANAEQYEESVRQLVAKDFNSRLAHKKLTALKVKVKLGAIIPPVAKDAILRKEKRRTNKQIVKNKNK